MLKRMFLVSVLSQVVLGAPGDPVTLQITPELHQRTAERMLHGLRMVTSYSPETQTRNGDEELFAADRRGNFGKSLAWNSLTFHKTEYDKMLVALESQLLSDWNALTRGGDGTFKLVSPLAAFAYDLQSADSWKFNIPAAPALQSAEAAGEMVEVYWHALLRDVPFNEYGDTSGGTLIQEKAIAGMNTLSDFQGPKNGGSVTAATLFRGVWSGDLDGPYISQFLYLPVKYGYNINWNGSGSQAPFDTPAYQEFASPKSGTSNNFMTTEVEWETVQKGSAPTGVISFDESRRWFIRNGRDLAGYVHTDTPAQAGIDAALILLGFGSNALDASMAYNASTNQAGFVTFGPVSIITQVAKVAELAFKAAWFQKWYVHRRLRPEVFAYLVHKQDIGDLNSGLHTDVMTASVLTELKNMNSNALLPLAYPEGSPCHPSYPAGHAACVGAEVTVLKAFFKESFVVPGPVQPNAANTDLESYVGPDLTIGGELNKLASNISIGRNTAGVHYRSDGTEGMLLGEKVAIKFLEDLGYTYHENFEGFTLTKFDGTTVTGIGARK